MATDTKAEAATGRVAGKGVADHHPAATSTSSTGKGAEHSRPVDVTTQTHTRTGLENGERRRPTPLAPMTNHISVLAAQQKDGQRSRAGVMSPPTPYTGSANYTDTEWREVQGWGSVKETKEIHKITDELGRKCINRYEIVREIGRGVHGKVKLARTMDTNELVALKVLPTRTKQRLGRPDQSAAHEAMLRREIAILKKCIHPHVVRLREVIEEPASDKIYLVLEYMWGGEVAWRDDDDKPVLKLHQARSTFRDTVLGLEFLHYQGIIHRDIKPANLLWTKNHSVKISDFGVSHISDASADEHKDALELAKTAGTPAFFAPELCWTGEGERPPITKAIDIWALGVTLFCLLCGRVPFEANNEYELFEKIAHEDIIIPADVDPEAKDLLERLLVKDARKRLTISEVKRHPFVLKGVRDADAWIRDTSPGLFGILEVSEAEVSSAVSTYESVKRRLSKFGSRIAMGLRRRAGLDANGKSHGKTTTSHGDPKSPTSAGSSWKNSFMGTTDSGTSYKSRASGSQTPVHMERSSSAGGTMPIEVETARRLSVHRSADDHLVEELTAAINNISSRHTPSGSTPSTQPSPSSSFSKPLPAAPNSYSSRDAGTPHRSLSSSSRYMPSSRRTSLASRPALPPFLAPSSVAQHKVSMTRSRGFDAGLTPDAMVPHDQNSHAPAWERELSSSSQLDGSGTPIGSIDGVLMGGAGTPDSDEELERTQIPAAIRSPSVQQQQHGFAAVRRIDEDRLREGYKSRNRAVSATSARASPTKFGYIHEASDDDDNDDLEGLTLELGRNKNHSATSSAPRSRAASGATGTWGANSPLLSRVHTDATNFGSVSSSVAATKIGCHDTSGADFSPLVSPISAMDNGGETMSRKQSLTRPFPHGYESDIKTPKAVTSATAAAREAPVETGTTTGNEGDDDDDGDDEDDDEELFIDLSRLRSRAQASPQH